MDANSFIYYVRRGMISILNIFNSIPVKPASNEAIDVIIPAIKKDLSILPLTIEGVRKNVNHKISAIYVVAPSDQAIIAFCQKQSLIFVDEQTVLGYGPKDINFITKSGLDRSGWIFQQLIKLSGSIGTNPRFLVIDADHILIKPHTFITDQQKFVFYHSEDCHLQYYKTIKALTGKRQCSILSYISHKMIFDKTILGQLKKKIEQEKGQPWDKAILSSLDEEDYSPFSEYELYGLYVPSKLKIHRTWKQKALKYEKVDSFTNLSNSKQYVRYWSLTFPSYKN